MQSTYRFASCAAVLQKNSMPEERSNWYHENKNISGSFRPTDKRISCVYISTTTVTTREEYKYPWIFLFTKKILKTQKYTNSLYEEKKKKKGEWKNFFDNNLTMYIILNFVPFLYFSLLRFVNDKSYPFLWLLLKKAFLRSCCVVLLIFKYHLRKNYLHRDLLILVWVFNWLLSKYLIVMFPFLFFHHEFLHNNFSNSFTLTRLLTVRGSSSPCTFILMSSSHLADWRADTKSPSECCVAPNEW